MRDCVSSPGPHKILESERMSEERRSGVLVQAFKNKGDVAVATTEE